MTDFNSSAAQKGAEPLVGQIQKPGGHLHKISRIALEIAGFKLASDGTTKQNRQTWTCDTAPSTDVLTGRIGDGISNVNDGFVDWSIVSSDALTRWKQEWAAANAETCAPKIQEVADLGLAGSCFMMMAPQQYADTDWQTLLLNPNTRIITSDRFVLEEFLAARGIESSNLQISERAGGTEPLACEMGNRFKMPVLVFDLVATGSSAFENGFVPVASGEESRVVLITNAEQARSEQLSVFLATLVENKETICQAASDLYVAGLAKKAALDEPIAAFARQRITAICAASTEQKLEAA